MTSKFHDGSRATKSPAPLRSTRLTALTSAIRSFVMPTSPKPRQRLRIEALEPRVLLSADPFTAALATPFDEDWSLQTETLELTHDVLVDMRAIVETAVIDESLAGATGGPYAEVLVLGRSLDEAASPPDADQWIVDQTTHVQRQLVFVDEQVEGLETLLDELIPVAGAPDDPVPIVDVVVLAADRDGVTQIGEYLADKTGIDAIHILAHGSSGSLSLGSATLDAASLDDYAVALRGWSGALSTHADILLYGCEVADGHWGASFLEDLAALTGADIAASDDLTGNAALGGDWDLEVTLGAIETLTLADQFDLTQFAGVLDIEVKSSSGTLFSNPERFIKSHSQNPAENTALDLTSIDVDLVWTIGKNGEITVKKKGGNDSLTVTGALELLAGSARNDFIILKGAAFGSSGAAGSIVGNAAQGSTSVLSFTPNIHNPDAFLTIGRVSAGVTIDDLGDPNNVISFGDVRFTVTRIDTVVGGKGSDEFVGATSSRNELFGGRGSDRLLGGALDDELYGGVGEDTLVGGLDDDELHGGSDADDLYGDREGELGAGETGGNDLLFGEQGNDTYHFYNGWGSNDQVIELESDGQDSLDLSGVDQTLNMTIGGSGTFVRIDTPSDGLSASFVERISLGTGANTITLQPTYLEFYDADSNTITIDNEMLISGGPRASLDLSAFAAPLKITVEAFMDGNNANGNKVTVEFPSGLLEASKKLIVFNVASITGTDGDDTVIIEKGATLPGTLDTGGGDDLIIIKGDDDTTLAGYANRIGMIDGGAAGPKGDTIRYEGDIRGGMLAAGDALIDMMLDPSDPSMQIPKPGDQGIALTIGAGNFPVVGSVERIENLDLGAVSGWHNVYGDGAGNALTGGSGPDALLGGPGDDNLTGGSGDDYLAGGGGEDTIVGGRGNDVIIGGADNDTLAGKAGADIYRFEDGWGVDTIESDLMDSKLDTLDFSQVTANMVYSLAAGRVIAGTGTFTRDQQGFPGFAGFASATGSFDSDPSTNVVTAERAASLFGASLRNNTISKIVVNGDKDQTFYFGSEWNTTTIEIGANATGKLVLDFSAATETLRFRFKADGSLEVFNLGTFSPLNALQDDIPKLDPPKITITNVNENTTIISGRNTNIYQMAKDGTYAGQLELTGGYQWLRVPASESAIPLGARVGHVIDVSQTIGADYQSLLADFTTGPAKVVAALGAIAPGNVGTALTAFAGEAGQQSLVRSRVNLFTGSAVFGESSGPIPGIAADQIIYGNAGTALFAKAKIQDIYFGSGINFLQGDNDPLGNTFKIKYARPGLHLMSGLLGPDTYSFANLWGAAAIAEIPDLTLGGIPIPESTDTLDFSRVFGENIVVDVFEGTLTDLIQIVDNAFGGDLPADWADAYDALGLNVATNIVIARSALPDFLPGVGGLPTSILVANDIESIIGPSAGELILRLHGDASLRGTVGPGRFGEVILDYSAYTGELDSNGDLQGIRTGLEDGSGEIAGFQLTGDFLSFQNNLLSPLFGDVPDPLGIVPPPQTTGAATGISGARFLGLTTIADFIAGIAGSEEEILAQFAIAGVSKVIGSAGPDDHYVGTAPKHYVLGAGDSILLNDGVAADETNVTVDLSAISENITFDLGSNTQNLAIPEGGVLYISSVKTAQRIIAGSGDDVFTDSDGDHAYVFGPDWGDDRIVLAGGTDTIELDVSLDDLRKLRDDQSWELVGQDLVITLNSLEGWTATLTLAGYADRQGSVGFGSRGIVFFEPPAVPWPLTGPLVSTVAAPVASVDAATASARLADALDAFAGRTVTLAGEIDTVTLSVETTSVGGIDVPRLVTDTGVILLDAADLSFAIDNLPGSQLVARDGGVITLDATAVDHGWYTSAAAPGAGVAGVDLVSALIHEVALQIGLDPAIGLSGATLAAGIRSVVPADLGTLTNDPLDPSPLLVAALPPGALADDADLTALVDEAIARWSQQAFAGGDPLGALTGVTAVVMDLDGDELARTLPDGTVALDFSAAGIGWFVDSAPFDDAEFADGVAIAGGAADGRIDLLTVLMHEFGHKLGLAHGSSDVLSEELDPGLRFGIPGGTINLLAMDATDAAKLATGLFEFTGFAEGLGANLDNLLDGTPIPFIDTSLAELLGIDVNAASLIADATTKLRDDIAALFNGDPVTTTDIESLADTTSADFRYEIARAPSSDLVAFVATIDLQPEDLQLASLDLSSLGLDGSPLGFSVDSNLKISIEGDLKLQFTFGIDPAGDFYVQDPSLAAELELSSGATPFDADISLGPLGLGIVGGSIELTGAMGLAHQGRMSYQQLIDEEVDPLALEALTSGRYDINLPIALTGSVQGVTANETAIRATGVLPGSVADLPSFIAGIDPEFINFDQLFALRGISLDQLLDAISDGLDALLDPNGPLFKKLPAINQSIADLLGDEVFGAGTDFIAGLKGIVDGARGGNLGQVESALNSAFNAVLGADTDPITIRYEDSVLLLEFDFEQTLAAVQREFSLDLQSFADQLGLPSEFADAVTDVLTIDGAGVTLEADLVAGFGFGVGLDLSNVLDPQRFLTSDSGVFARLTAGAADPVDIDVELDLGALGIPGLEAIGLGDITTVGFSIDGGAADLSLLLEFGLPGSPEGIYLLDDPLPAAEVRVSGDASLDLPLFIGNVPVGGTAGDLDGDGFGDNVLHIGASFADTDFEFDVVSPGFDQLLSLAGFLNDPQNIIDGLDLLFDTLGGDFGDVLSGLGLPLLGNALNDAADFIDDGVDGSGSDLRETVIGSLQDVVDANPGKTTIELVVQALESLTNGTPIIVTSGADFVQFDLVMAGNILSEQFDIDFGLGDLIEVDGQIDVSLDYTFGLGFGFSLTDGFYLNTDGVVPSGEEFLLALSATIPGLNATGTLPLLAMAVKEVDGDADGASGLFGNFTVDLQDAGNDGRWSLLGESGSVEAELEALANVDLDLEVSIPNPSAAQGAPPLFPTITTTFHYDQLLASIGTGGSSGGEPPFIEFEDVTLNLGEFISGFVAPIAAAIGQVTEPLEPLFSQNPSNLGLFYQPITLLQQLGLNEVTLIDIASNVLGETKFGPVLQAIEAVSDIITLVGSVNDFIDANPGPLLINFGSFTVGGNGEAVPDADNGDVQDQLDNTDPAAKGVTDNFGTTKGSFQFPLLTDPATAFGLLLGEDVDLFLYDMPALDLNFTYVKSVPIFPGLNARFGGAVTASTNFTFGFDTSGFNDWKDLGYAFESTPLVLNGMFFDDHGIENSGNDAPEASVSAAIIAGASVGVPGLVEAGIDGNIKAQIDFDLNDVPDPLTGAYDGKIRADELAIRLAQGIECIFDTSGALTYGLDAFFWVGADLGFLGKITVFEARKNFARGTLATFDHECPDPTPTELGILSADGTLDLLVEKSDGARFSVSQENLEIAENVFEERIVLRTGAFIQTFLADDVTKIVTDGTSGSENLVIGGRVDADLDLDLGGGSDSLVVSSGGFSGAVDPLIRLRGGDGDDEIIVHDSAEANIDIDGGAGDDRIMVSSAGGFDILIHGGDDNDTIIGSDEDDLIFGDAGNDILYGFEGDDEIHGGDDNDLIYGGDDHDLLYGGLGDDRIQGDQGQDKLYGDAGDDTLTGGADRDWVYGGLDSDTIVWSYGDTADFDWVGGDGTTSADPQASAVDTVSLSGVVVDDSADQATEAFDDTVSLSRVAGTADAAVSWQREGVPGHARFGSDSSVQFAVHGFEQFIVDLGAGSDALTIDDLEGSSVANVAVNFGTTESNDTTDVNGETFLIRNVTEDSGADTLSLFGSDLADLYTVEGSPAGLIIEQSRLSGPEPTRVLGVSLLNSDQTRDRVRIITGDGDDRVDASAVGEFNHLEALVIDTGAGEDTIIGSPFVDHIDSGLDNDTVTGGAGIDLFADAGGDNDRLFEARDVNFALTDVELRVDMVDEGFGVEQPDGSIKFTRNVVGAEIEDISGGNGGIFEEIYLTGYDGSEGLDGSLSVNVFSVSEFTKDAFLNGGAAADIYNVQLSGGTEGAFSSFIDIVDDGGPQGAGFDVLNIEGTDEADTFGFRRDIVERISSRDEDQGEGSIFAPVDNFSTDIIKRDTAIDPNLNRQVVNYLSVEDMVIHGRGGGDLFLVDDSSTELAVYGDSGDDRFFIGSVIATEFVPHPTRPGELVEVVKRDGGLTNGVSFPASFFGGKGDDYFEVNHNIAEISLYGEDGDDIFFLKALLTTEPSAGDDFQPQESINVFSQPGENDTIAYVRNAPVNIFGGEGFDTLVIVGTVLDDTFVIFTEHDPDLGREVQRVFGAGLVVPVIDNIERLLLVTGSGDDTVHLYGTLNDQEIVINTGSGNDTVNIGGAELDFDVTIPESQYTKKNLIPRPDLVETVTTTIPARFWFSWDYKKVFGFRWVPVLVPHFTPAREVTRVVRTPQAPLEVPEVVTVPEFTLSVHVPETRALDKINGPVFIDGLDAFGTDDNSIIIDNRDGDVADPGTLQKQTVEVVDINTGDGEEDAAKEFLAGALPAGIDVDALYRTVADYLEDQNRVRQPGLIDAMLANPAGNTEIDLRPGRRIQAFTSLADFLAYAPAVEGSYAEVDPVTGVTETKTFSLAELSASGGNAFLPDDVFTMEVGGELQSVEAELLYDVNGNITGINVFAENEISFSVSNEFVRSQLLDEESTETFDALSGFGLGVGVFYEDFSLIDLQLSNGDDVLTIEDTTANATTNVFGGGGDDRIDVLGSSGVLNIFGDVAGPDTVDLGIPSNVTGRYAEDFRDADNAAAIGSLLGVASFDADNIEHVRALIDLLNTEFPGNGLPTDTENDVFEAINLDTDDYQAQIWELLKRDVNTLLGDAGNYRLLLEGPVGAESFAADLAALLGFAPGTEFDDANREHLAALAQAVNAKAYDLTVEIALSGSAESLRNELDLFLPFVWQTIGGDVAPGIPNGNYRDYLAELGELFELGQDFDLNSRPHLQLLAGLVNLGAYQTTVNIDTSATVEELTLALETFDEFVWRLLKQDLVRIDPAGAPPQYNPLADDGDYRTQLDLLASILGSGGTFDPEDVADVRVLAAALNDQFPSLSIDVDGIRLEPNVDLDGYRLPIWQLITEINPLVEVPAGNDTVNVYGTGGQVVIRGQAGDDSINDFRTAPEPVASLLAGPNVLNGSEPVYLLIGLGGLGNDSFDASASALGVVYDGGVGDDLIIGSQAGDRLAGGSGNDRIFGEDGVDLIYGDSGLIVDANTGLFEMTTVGSSDEPHDDPLTVGNDELHGGADEDIIFGDHGVITFHDPAMALLTTAHSAIARIDSAELDDGGEDIIYGDGDADILIGGANSSNLLGDAIDGGAGDDLIFGDNVSLVHRTADDPLRLADPRLRVLDGTTLYDGQGGIGDSAAAEGPHPQIQGVIAEYLITDLDHSLAVQTADGTNFGADYLAGGADDDAIFGQLGNDVIQGDGGIGDGINGRVGAARDAATGELTVDASTEAESDGDDYIEGNAGSDVIFGNLGQDDIVGGSSSLFSLTSRELRPDAGDLIFGGAGLRIARNYAIATDEDVDTLVIESPHARDADMIAGDNANIYRVVGIDGIESGLLSFSYDSVAGRGSERIIVRAVDLIDYTPGGADYDPAGAATDIGAADEIHGESGDDAAYGMKGDDVLFGDSEDDDLIGGYDRDWISGGSGSDGVLGDDGRIYTSRNTAVDGGDPLAEPLYGIAKLAEVDREISTPGRAQQAIIDVDGALKKTANLTPFNIDDEENNLYRAGTADDILFGGLGDDFVHGGSGDDAISGAEALPSTAVIVYPIGGAADPNRADGTLIRFGFDNPLNPGNVLGYGALRGGEFAAYDEFDPLVKILVDGQEYFLNFNAGEGLDLGGGIFSDGNDRLFGDLGNDWLVGGTGFDRMYGGRGDDLLNADDDHETAGGQNNTYDAVESYADIAFGGAGRDVLIANTGNDRLIDWAGEFNSYLVPFAAYGDPTISRALQPGLFDYLYDLSASDGADPTRAADEGSDGARNGEPFGELGLVTQKDFDWQIQTGAPTDVQPGNVPGGPRDVVRLATFNQGTADGFLADVGNWSVTGSRLQVSPEVLGGDAVSVFYVDDLLPSYFELQATIQGGKPIQGYKSNAYLIFDYQSPTDFKFAGVNISTDKLEMGHRDASGWHVDVQVPGQLKPDKDYNLLLALNGNVATLVVDNRDVLTHTYAPRIDADGFQYGLNAGMVGIGAFNSNATIDNVAVQVLPRDVELVRESDFDTTPADFLSGTRLGSWTQSGGTLTGDGAVGGAQTVWGGNVALITSDVKAAPGQVVEIETTLEPGGAGGIVFDLYGESDYKFVLIDASGQVSIGHQSGDRWGIEASAAMPAQVSGDYDIKVTLVGSAVSVFIDNQSVVSYSYNALTGDGALGLLAASNARFGGIAISTNDPAYLDAQVGDALRVESPAGASEPGTTGQVLDGQNLQPLLDAAIDYWGAGSWPGLDDISIWVTDLPGDLLGLTFGDVIYIDRDAAGLGWFIDSTPEESTEFDENGTALAGTEAAAGIDLLSVIVHEVGHVLGYEHDAELSPTISAGERDIAGDSDDMPDTLAERETLAAQWTVALSDERARIAPFNLGLFRVIQRQMPWAVPGAGATSWQPMLWDAETGDFEPEPAVHRVFQPDHKMNLLEFIEETGEWLA